MRRLRPLLRIVGWLAALGALLPAAAQNVGALSVYEGQRILAVSFDLNGLPADPAEAARLREEIRAAFPIRPYTHFSRMQAEYSLSQLRSLPFVRDASLLIVVTGEGGLELTVAVDLAPTEAARSPRTQNLFRDLRAFPVVYARGNTFVTFRAALSEMVYSNRNAWFGRPQPFNEGNPLADRPAGAGWTAWLEGYGMAGLYAIARIVRPLDLHLYGGLSGIAAFSAGRELFTAQSRLRLGAEDAFAGVVGGGRDAADRIYSYNATFGRKSFVLGNGWLIVNTAMNGQVRAALQLNPRWAARQLFQIGGRYDKFMGQFFRIRPDELPTLDSRTVLNGVNAEYAPNEWVQAGAAYLAVPRSGRQYYLHDGKVASRRGLRVWNLRLYGNPPAGRPGPFYKAEVGWQRNAHFDMRAYAWYMHLGWNFARTAGTPALSYRFAYFSGDDPRTAAYERWDALYTGGNGEQWVQGANMYKIVQNANEMTHLIQLSWMPLRKLQFIGQLWAFAAPERNNLGGNPALSELRGRYYGTEFDLTIKYFRSARWYFHFNAAYTLPGDAVRNAAPRTRDWFSLMFFFRYSL